MRKLVVLTAVTVSFVAVVAGLNSHTQPAQGFVCARDGKTATRLVVPEQGKIYVECR